MLEFSSFMNKIFNFTGEQTKSFMQLAKFTRLLVSHSKIFGYIASWLAMCQKCSCTVTMY